MKKGRTLQLASFFSLIGIFLWAIFGQHLLLEMENTIRFNAERITPLKVKWIALGAILYAVGEASTICFEFKNRTVCQVNTKAKIIALSGHAIQIMSLAIAGLGLLIGMRVLYIASSQVGGAGLEEVIRPIQPARFLLMAGLIGMLIGEGLKMYGSSLRLRTFRFAIENGIAVKGKISWLIGFASLPLLLLILLLFVYTTLFDYALAARQSADYFDFAESVSSFQGMMVYPFLACVLTIFYCIMSMLRIGLLPSVPRR